MQYDRPGGSPRVTGYVVTNTVRAEIRRLDDVGRLIDAALSKGANQIAGLQLYASRTDDARRIALGEAVAKARADAEAIARSAAGSLGPLLEVTAGAPPIRPFEVTMRAAPAVGQGAPTPIEAGEETIRASVTARWVFVPGR